MIKGYISSLAAQLGIPLSEISVVDGRDVGCVDVYLLHLASNDHLVHVLIHQSEWDLLQNGVDCDRLELKIRSALSRLQQLLQS
jgi:hypothetical protein